MAATHNRLMDVAGRMPDWDRINPRYIEGFDLLAVLAAPSVPVAPDALLHLGHRGLLVELFDTTDPDRAQEWLRNVHLPGLLAGPGVAAAASFQPAILPPVEAPWVEGTAEAAAAANGGTDSSVRLLVVVVVDGPPVEVAAGLRARSDASVAADPDSEQRRRAFHGIFDIIQPLDYDFISDEQRSQEVAS